MLTQNHLINAFIFLIPAVLFYLLLVWRRQNPQPNQQDLHPAISKLLKLKDWILVVVFIFASLRSFYFWFTLQR